MSQKNFRCCLAALVMLFCAGSAGLTAGGVPNDAARQMRVSPLSAKITDAQLKYLGSPEPEMDILGAGFGAVQGTKNVQVDGALITTLPGWSVIHWSDSSISLQANNIVPWEHVYSIALTDGKIVVSNLLSKRFNYSFDGLKPTSGLPGSTVQLYVWDLPAAPGGLVLKCGPSYNFTILVWGNPIEATVPVAPPGNYEVFLMKGRNVVSQKTGFTVHLKIIKPPIKK